MTPEPSPSAAPLTQAQLAAAYRGCAKPYNKEIGALNKQFAGAGLKKAKRLVKEEAAVVGTFIACIRAIQWTPEYAADVRDLLKADSAVQVTMLEMSVAGSLAEYNDLGRTADKQGLTAESAANQLRGDLGLPPPPQV